MHPLLALATPANIATALIAINFLTFTAFALDMARAETGAWRISENALLNLAMIGGTPGGFSLLSRFPSRQA